jgi:hypothetical protein
MRVNIQKNSATFEIIWKHLVKNNNICRGRYFLIIFLKLYEGKESPKPRKIFKDEYLSFSVQEVLKS